MQNQGAPTNPNWKPAGYSSVSVYVVAENAPQFIDFLKKNSDAANLRRRLPPRKKYRRKMLPAGPVIAYTVSRPTSPCCLELDLPIHTTLQRTELSGSSSSTISTVCPRLN